LTAPCVAPLLDRKRFDPDNLALLASSSPHSFLGVAVSRQTPHKHKSEGEDALVLDFRLNI
jgi:hypothetical protein